MARREWRFVWSGQSALVVRRSELEPGEKPVPAVSEEQIRRWFDELPVRVASLLSALPSAPTRWRNREEMLAAVRRIKQGFERGELALLPSQTGSDSGGGGGQPQAPPPPPPQKASAFGSEKTYFTCQLLDEDGSVMRDESYRLAVTDGSSRTGALDSDGSVYVPRIDPGDCTIAFPEIRLNPRKKKG